MSIFSDLMAAIPVYTGLSPVAFFTIVALLTALYYIVSGFFAAPPEHNYVPSEPLPPPVQLGDVTEEELRAYDGSDPSKPLLMAIKGQIYDVSQSRMFYGPGGPYALFTGKDASRALAKMSFEEEDLTGNLEGLSGMEMDALQDWEWKFMSKYVKVGQVPSKEEVKSRDVPVTDTAQDGEVGDIPSKEEVKSREVPVTDTAQDGEVGDIPSKEELKSRELPIADAAEDGAKPGEETAKEETAAAE